MEFEVSFELNLENTFCESSFLVVRAGKRRSIPSIKRLDIQLSKIKTTFNRKVSFKNTKLAVNLETDNLAANFTSIFQSNLSKHSVYRKNSHKKITYSNLNKRITKYTNTNHPLKNKSETELFNKTTQLNGDQIKTNKATNRPRMGVASLKKNTLNEEITRPSIVPLPFLDFKPESSLTHVSLSTIKQIKKSKNLHLF